VIDNLSMGPSCGSAIQSKPPISIRRTQTVPYIMGHAHPQYLKVYLSHGHYSKEYSTMILPDQVTLVLSGIWMIHNSQVGHLVMWLSQIPSKIPELQFLPTDIAGSYWEWLCKFSVTGSYYRSTSKWVIEWRPITNSVSHSKSSRSPVRIHNE